MEQTEVNAASQVGLTEYTIIEDCSPYYIRFTHPGIEKVNEIFLQHLEAQNFHTNQSGSSKASDLRTSGWNPLKLDEIIKHRVSDKIPFWNDFNFSLSLYATSTPGVRFPIHKDTKFDRVGINYLLETHDDNCVTNFYSEESVSHLPQKTLNTYSQGPTIDKDAECPAPIKTAIFKQGEAILFNPGIWHDWDNSTGSGRRVNVLLRGIQGYPSFEEIRKKLFGY